MVQDPKGKTAIITGGTKGIGFGIAEAMLQAGMNVFITGRNEEGVNDAISKMLGKDTGKVEGIAADVRSADDMNRVAQECLKTFGSIDVLVANAGVGHFGNISDMTLDQWHETIDVNLSGVFNSVKSCLEPLKESGGYIITIASLAGTNFFAGGTAYNASKFGLVGFTQALMLDLRQEGVNVTTIMPGSVSSYFNDRTPGAGDAWKIQPEDLGQMVVDLLRIDPRTLPSKIEVRPSRPPAK